MDEILSFQRDLYLLYPVNVHKKDLVSSEQLTKQRLKDHVVRVGK